MYDQQMSGWSLFSLPQQALFIMRDQAMVNYVEVPFICRMWLRPSQFALGFEFDFFSSSLEYRCNLREVSSSRNVHILW